jgi:hypothetical protein
VGEGRRGEQIESSWKVRHYSGITTKERGPSGPYLKSGISNHAVLISGISNMYDSAFV